MEVAKLGGRAGNSRLSRWAGLKPPATWTYDTRSILILAQAMEFEPSASHADPPPPALPAGSDPAWCAALIRHGGQGAFPEDAVAELRQFVRRAVRRSIHGPPAGGDSLIDDLTQESTLRVLTHLPSFRGDSRFTTWATTVAVNTAFTVARRLRWRGVSLDQLRQQTEDGGSFDVAADTPVPGHDDLRRDVLGALRRAVASALTDRQRTALEAELAGMPINEVADRLGTNPNALYKLLHDPENGFARPCCRRESRNRT